MRPLVVSTLFALTALLGHSGAVKARQPDDVPVFRHPEKISTDAFVPKKGRFEASGSVFVPRLRQFVTVSDDTDDEMSPWLFLQGVDGQLAGPPVTIQGLKYFADAESISLANEKFYVMGSLRTENGESKKEFGNAFLELTREGTRFTLSREINLGKRLRALLKETTDSRLRELSKKEIEDLEVEAHAIRGKDLYIALKWPQEREKFVHILKIPDFDPIFTKGDEILVNLERWKTIPLPKLEGEVQYISDMLFLGQDLYFVSSCFGKECGGLWKLPQGMAEPDLLAVFPDGKAEGLAFNPMNRTFLVTFDMAKKGSSFVFVPLEKN